MKVNKTKKMSLKYILFLQNMQNNVDEISNRKTIC